MNEKEKLLRKVQYYCFAALESALFLDTHPDCKEALAYHTKHKKMAQEATKEYEEKYGPITTRSTQNEDSWQWVNAPWPWEYSANGEV